MRATRVSLIEKVVDGLPVLMTEFGYKTFSMVVKSLGYVTQRTSPTYYRTSGVMETRFGQPEVSAEYPTPSARYIVDLYSRCSGARFETLVVSPGLELACYLGRVLQAPVLPSQFIASAPNLRHVESASVPENLYVVGHEADWPRLCVWIKPLELGQLYSELVDQARTVIIVSHHSGDSNEHGTPRAFARDRISINGVDGGPRYWELLEDPERRGYVRTADSIPHWEFAMDLEQIVGLERYCAARGIRTVTVSTGDWSGFLPAKAYARLYRKNRLRPTGVTFHTYWGCHPFYESEFLRIPIHNFQYGADRFVAEFGKWLGTLEFERRDGEYIIWSEEYFRTRAMDPAARFESWGFPTIYRTDRPYDVWQFAWEEHDDPRNPTREWVLPRLKARGAYRTFDRFLTPEELIEICREVPKTRVTVQES